LTPTCGKSPFEFLVLFISQDEPDSTPANIDALLKSINGEDNPQRPALPACLPSGNFE
jgi:hypothetical protein